MKIENQVCTAQQGKRLMELGISNESLFHHVIEETALGIERRVAYLASPPNNHIPAFTVAELGVMMPSGYDTMRLEADLNKWRGYDLDGADCPSDFFDTEAECRAAMIIFLLENGHITADECNKRLLNA